jgi:hypothetical protein
MTTPNRPPLWVLIPEAFTDSAKEGGPSWTCRDGIAAETRALRDWLLPEEPPLPPDSDTWIQLNHSQRQRLRALLTAEADRAERGDG